VHKAKGLEYPVVFLPGMNQAARSLTIGPEALISEADGAQRIAIKDATNPVYEDMWKGEHGEQDEITREQQRLLYVAMTRARDHLIMLGALGTGKTPIKQNTWLDYVHKTLISMSRKTDDKADGRIVQYSCPDWRTQDLSPGPQTGRQRNNEAQREREVEIKTIIDNISPIPRSETPEWKRATDFIVQGVESLAETPFASDEAMYISPLTRGSVLHRCLEEYTKAGAYDIGRVVAEYPEIMALGRDAQHNVTVAIESIVSSVLGNQDSAWIFERRDRSYSELPFLYKKSQSLVSGIIDRVVIREGIGSVVDYKSILIENDEALKSWKEHYRPQIKVYCEAVKEIFGLERVDGYLLFLDSNRLELIV
jgi:ATP-dependent exoDNAse (exonuclease V) beta subunit